MTRYAILCAALVLAAPGTAQDQTGVAADPPSADRLAPLPDSADFDLAKRRVAECEGEKFVFAWGAGANPTRVTLCSKKDATPQDVVVMLEDAATKVEQMTGLAEDRRDAIVLQIRAKIAELQGTTRTAQAAEPTEVAQLPQTPPQPVMSSPVAQLPAPVARAPAPVARPAPVAPRPRLSFQCDTAAHPGTGGPCTIIGDRTLLIVTADEPLAGGTSLRFVRRGRIRAEVPLRQMRAGQSVKMMVPKPLCDGVFKSEASIEVVTGGRVVDSIGPYLLRC